MQGPGERTKQAYLKMGYIVGVVEKWNPHVGPQVQKNSVICPDCRAEIPQWKSAGIRQDLWQFADIIAFHPDRISVILIQCTSGGNHAKRKAKLLANEIAKDWVQSQNRILYVVSWSKRAVKNKDGSRSKRDAWTLRQEEITASMFQGEPF